MKLCTHNNCLKPSSSYEVAIVVLNHHDDIFFLQVSNNSQKLCHNYEKWSYAYYFCCNGGNLPFIHKINSHLYLLESHIQENKQSWYINPHHIIYCTGGEYIIYPHQYLYIPTSIYISPPVFIYPHQYILYPHQYLQLYPHQYLYIPTSIYYIPTSIYIYLYIPTSIIIISPPEFINPQYIPTSIYQNTASLN